MGVPMFKLVHAGFDTFDIAFQGALPADALTQLEMARDDAAKRQEPALTSLGPAQVDMHVEAHGARGGYAFLADTGPLGCKWFFKNNADPRQWNIFASPRATALLAYGYHGVRDRLWATLTDMGAQIADHAVNRVDFAMDFRTSGFELALDQFVAHPHTKVSPHWGTGRALTDRNQPAAVVRGRRLESVTIGKMPGRQIIVYDKRREAIERQKFFWFPVWGIERSDTDTQIWRIEIRAGKKELKDRWNMRRCADVDASIGDVCLHALHEVRYTDDVQSDTNVTRHRLHALWEAAQVVCQRNLANFQSGLLPGQIVEIARDLAADRYAGLTVGNAIGYGVATGLSDDEIVSTLPALIADRANALIQDDKERLRRTIKRARTRLHFLTQPHKA